ncbi:MAG: sigma 54-interacting transcriptional regulator [Myxococcales bacterium]|nr:sigma 54-interacting transcriptional regulator [Myxococcales bacterium]MDP3237011.1 sigma 54-interacting transcriptional regulator [Myxococcales bacterium]MDP3501484.1 sigma 54-interacting transcriptional regulator [Myxococcales bacterium]
MSPPELTESVTIPGETISRVPVREWTVEVVAGPDKGKKVSTLEGLVRVGSDPANDLVLTDTTVSRRHLEIERTLKGLLLRDLSSRNGTFIEGRQVLQAFIDTGDKITLGKTRLSIKRKTRDTEIELLDAETFGELVGTSEAMRIVFAELRRIAREDVTLLIEGETGTGKELAARAVHALSAKRYGPFRVVDCAMLSEQNADRELFGEDGAFLSGKNGTVFLDEVAELPAGVQPKLVRLLETKEIPAMAGQPARRLDIRIIASTARNLAEEVQQGRFRQELFFRIAIARVRLPPLRTRKIDIPLLARHLVKGLSVPFDLSPQTLSLLEGYDWPGNVRELRNVLERGALMQSTGNRSWLDLLVQGEKRTDHTTLIEIASKLPYHEAKDRVTGDFERHYFAEVMKQANFDMQVAEQRTGLSMQSLYRLLKKNGLRLKDLKNAEGLG